MNQGIFSKTEFFCAAACFLIGKTRGLSLVGLSADSSFSCKSIPLVYRKRSKIGTALSGISLERLEDRRLLAGLPQLLTAENAYDGPITEMVAVGSINYFVVSTNAQGSELWKSNGTVAGTMLVKDILPGPSGANPHGLTNFNGTLFFAADNGVDGVELWKSDGTETGTSMVKNIRSAGNSSYPHNFKAINGTLYFAADDGLSGVELWKTDGSQAGTIRVKNISPGGFNDGGNYFFNGSFPNNLTNFNGTLFFSALVEASGYELWRSDGSDAGTVMVQEIRPGGSGSYPAFLTSAAGSLFFSALGLGTGDELFKSDGFGAGTSLVKDIYSGADGSTPTGLTELNGNLYFSANDGTSGTELWKSDGSSGGTTQVSDIYPLDSSSIPTGIVNLNGTLYFSADNGVSGAELWKSNGTQAGTVQIKDIQPASIGSQPAYFTLAHGSVYFTADDGTTGTELWKTDGTEQGTQLVQDLQAGGLGSNPNLLTAVGDSLFFAASDSVNGHGLWVVHPNVVAQIVARYAYHANSSFAAVSVADALDQGKQLAKQGPTPQLLTFDNLINTTRGINGLVFDIQDLPGALVAADFEFRMSPPNTFQEGLNPPDQWQFAPAPQNITVIPGSPARVVIQWSDNAIANRWLRVTVKSNANTGLSEPEVYYLGHLLGETTGGDGSNFSVSYAQDLGPIRITVGTNVGASSPVDIDKNGKIQLVDIVAMRGNAAQQLTQITIPGGGGSGSWNQLDVMDAVWPSIYSDISDHRMEILDDEDGSSDIETLLHSELDSALMLAERTTGHRVQQQSPSSRTLLDRTAVLRDTARTRQFAAIDQAIARLSDELFSNGRGLLATSFRN